MNKYAKIEFYDEDGDLSRTFIDNISDISYVIENELGFDEDTEVGTEIRVAIVEMTEAEFYNLKEFEGM